jgi:hypothetical protein
VHWRQKFAEHLIVRLETAPSCLCVMGVFLFPLVKNKKNNRFAKCKAAPLIKCSLPLLFRPKPHAEDVLDFYIAPRDRIFLKCNGLSIFNGIKVYIPINALSLKCNTIFNNYLYYILAIVVFLADDAYGPAQERFYLLSKFEFTLVWLKEMYP